MKKSLSVLVLGTFLINSVTMAYSNPANNSKLVRQVVMNQLKAKIGSMSDSEQTKLMSEVNSALDEIIVKLDTITDEQFEVYKSNLDNAVTNEASTETVYNKMTAKDKAEIAKTLSDEDLLLASSEEAAVRASLQVAEKEIALKFKDSFKGETKESFKTKIMTTKEKMKYSWNAYRVGLVVGTGLVILAGAACMITYGAMLPIMGLMFGGIGLAGGTIGATIGLAIYVDNLW